MDDLYLLTASAAAAAIRDGRATSLELVDACLKRIEALEPTVRAWAHLDPEHARAQAKTADAQRASGRPTGALHGVPVAVKDIFDTFDMPTEDGAVLHAGRTPAHDAQAVSLLRAAGAIVLGKTVTTELACFSPGKTRNPHDPERTPGGSSSGSAAAVAAAMAPLAIGSQTNGSVIRPAAFCGVWGFKPTHGAISRHRVLQCSRALDHVGVFARTVEDAALLADQLIGYDARDPDTRPAARPNLAAVAAQAPPAPPRLAMVKTPMWDQAEDYVQQGFAELCAHLGERVSAVALPAAFETAIDAHRVIWETDLARNFRREYDDGRDRLSDQLAGQIERGRNHAAVAYLDAIEQGAALNAMLDEFFPHYDALLTPAAPGEAPKGLEATGSPAFCTIWSLCGTPAVAAPLLSGPNGLPVGVQLVGQRGDDGRLLRTARWLAESVNDG